jgi:Nucleotidyl transferase AbiEii toxin, Type IV TA system
VRPRNPRERLDRALPRYAAASEVPEQRLRTWLSFIAIAGALQNALEQGLIASYQIKGGVALELRYPGRVRTTRDLDVGMLGSRQTRLDAFAQALDIGFDEFTFRVKGPAFEMERADTIRVQVVISYRGRGHQTLDVDLGPADATAVDDVALTMDVIGQLSIAMPKTLRCISLSAQIAQKIHASTHPAIVADPTQDRARDIIDILTLDILKAFDYDEIRRIARATFAQRATHDWPPSVPDYPASWRSTLERLAGDVGLPYRAAPEIIAAFDGFIVRLLAAQTVPRQG